MTTQSEPDLLAEVTEMEREDVDVPDLPYDMRQSAEAKYRRTFDYYNGRSNVDAHAVALTEAFKTVWEAGYRAGWDAGDNGLSDLAIDNAVEAKLESVWETAHEAVGELAVTLAPVLRSVHPFDVREDTSRIVEEVLKAADR